MSNLSLSEILRLIEMYYEKSNKNEDNMEKINFVLKKEDLFESFSRLYDLNIVDEDQDDISPKEFAEEFCKSFDNKISPQECIDYLVKRIVEKSENKNPEVTLLIKVDGDIKSEGCICPDFTNNVYEIVFQKGEQVFRVVYSGKLYKIS